MCNFKRHEDLKNKVKSKANLIDFKFDLNNEFFRSREISIY